MQTKLFFVLIGLCFVGNAFGQERSPEKGRVTAKPAVVVGPNPVTQLRGEKEAVGLTQDPRVIEYVDKMLKDYDKNNDGAIDSTEWKDGRWSTPPESSDTNKDGKLDHDELLQRIALRFGLAQVNATAAVANEKAVGRKLIHFEFVLIERATADLANDKHKTPTVEQLLALEKDGKAAHVQRLKLNALENVEARLQLGEDAPFVSGRVNRAGGGFGGSQESITYNSLGTTLTLTAETESDGKVLASLNLARSSVAPTKSAEKVEGQESTTPSYPRRLASTIVTTVRIKPGEATLVGGQQTPTGTTAGDLWLIVTAKVE